MLKSIENPNFHKMVPNTAKGYENPNYFDYSILFQTVDL